MAHILIANVGSTSLKYKLVDIPSLAHPEQQRSLAEGSIERIGMPGSAVVEHLRYDAQGELQMTTLSVHEPDYQTAIDLMLSSLIEVPLGVLDNLAELDAVGFKAVHGGVYRQPVIVNEAVLAEMARLSPAAPAHNPPYIKAMRLFHKLIPKVPLVAVWETTFHATMPDYARVYAVPLAWREEWGIEHYGFHGASHRYISQRIAQIAPGPAPFRVISCHLGGSSSLCAILDGRSLDTSMGFSPQSGLPQTKRTGDLDPFVPLWLLREGKATVDELNRILNTQSGLAGISGGSGDMRDLLAAEEAGDERAHLAIESYCYTLVKTIGAYYVVLGGLDRLVFTGGMGEKGVAIRARVVKALTGLGLELDEERNAATRQEARISTPGSRAEIWVVPTDEGQVVAEETAKVLLAHSR
jgi:acetate kinase